MKHEKTIDDPVTLSRAARFSCVRVNGRPRHVATIYRWAERGVRGIRLQTYLVGGVRCTNLRMVRQFLERCNGEERAPASTPSARSRAIRRAEEELRRDGID